MNIFTAGIKRQEDTERVGQDERDMGNVKPRRKRTVSPVVRALARCAAGALFLLNPNLDVVDLVPDALGYLLIVSGLKMLEPVSPSIEEARNRFSMLLRISVIRIVSLPVRMSVGYNEKTFILIFTLAFAVLETMYLLPAFHYLYDGTSYLALRHGQSAAKTKAPRIISGVFAVGRAVLNVLPELKYLPSQQYYSEFEGPVVAYERIKLAQLSHMLLLVNLVFTALLSTVWVIRFRLYLRRLRKDPVFDRSLAAELAEQPRDMGLELLGKMKPAFTLISLAMFAGLDFYADGFNLVPDFLPALLLLAAAFYLYRANECKRSLPTVASIYAVLTAALGIYNYIFASKHYALATLNRPDALRMQFVHTVLASVCSLVFAVLMFMFCMTLVGVTNRHAGLFAEPEFRTTNLKTQRQRLRVRNLIWTCFALTILAEAMQVVYGALVIKHAILWIPAAAITVALGALTASTLGNLYYQIELRHGKVL